jgi:peptidase M1-like protein
MSFERIAESDYTRAAECRADVIAAPARMLARAVRSASFQLVCLAATLFLARGANAQAPSPQPPAATQTRSAHQLYGALNALRVDPAAVYRVEAENRIRLRRGDATLAFDEGKLAFFVALDGQITGAVFSGRGHALAAPRDPVEKQQMARFLGATVLDEDFSSAYIRFTDNSAAELLDPLRSAKTAPQNDPEFADRWEPLVRELNAGQSLRMLDSLLTQNPKPYFYGAIDGTVTGPFDLFYDLQRREPFLMGQPRRMEGQTSGAEYYDVWVSYGLPGDPVTAEAFRALNYSIETTIDPNRSLEATATIELQAVTGGDRLLPFALARSLPIDKLTDENGTPVEFFQNEGLTAQARTDRGDDALYVVLPQAPPADARLRLRFHYRGTVIEDAGNGVLVVQARDSWYPHLGDTSAFAPYELTMRWPRKLQLVATGRKLDERLDGDFRVGRWRTDTPVSVAGFNLGEYASATVSEPAYSVDLYANKQLEQALSERLQAAPEPPVSLPGMGRIADAERGKLPGDAYGANTTPRPADALRALGKEIAASIAYYEKFSGPFPFRALSVSQIPGSFGQGWPGLLYLSTYAYLSTQAQRQAGLSTTGQEHFTQLVPFHEVAHQWWGNVVGWSSYRDQWIDEAIASYLALMFADSRKPQEHELRLWLDRFRKSLLVKPATSGEEPAAETGALTLGSRLNSSKAPTDYEVLVYSKGSWVLHMLREMLRQPGAKDPDARFTMLLQTLSRKYAYRALSTSDLQKEVEAVMTPSMDLEGGRSMEWFFDQWVRGTGIPHYHVEFTARPDEKGVLVKGTLTQSGVPRSFISPVPIYAAMGTGGAGRPVFLGTVTAEGNRTAFHFLTPSAPHKLLVDPEMTLLCVSE